MPTIQNEFERLKARIAKGEGNERCMPLVVLKDANVERVNNVKKRTRFAMETNSERFYSELNAAKDRVLGVIENKTVAIEILIKLWSAPSDEQLREMAKGD